VAKVSMEEWPFITGGEDFAAGAKLIMDRGVQLVVRSEGPGGATYAAPRATGHVDAFKVDCVEPTGAGDGFAACLIVELLKHFRQGVGPAGVDNAELKRIVRRASAVGALACTKVGAIPSLPTAEEVDDFLRGRRD
jgi:sugar/nucleoside kinase (ribokinase family)